MQLIRTLASGRPDLTAYRQVEEAYRISLKSLARRYLELHDEIADLDEMIEAIVKDLAPELLSQTAIGVNSAAQLLLTAGDNSDRLKSGGKLRRIVRRQPRPRFFRETGPAQVEQGWGSRGKQCHPHHRYREASTGCTHIGLRRTTDRSRKLEARGNSLPQTLHRRRRLHYHHAAAQGRRPRSSIAGDHGEALKPWSSPGSNGRLSQQPPPSGAHRKHSACRGRRTILCYAGRTSHSRVT